MRKLIQFVRTDDYAAKIEGRVRGIYRATRRSDERVAVATDRPNDHKPEAGGKRTNGGGRRTVKGLTAGRRPSRRVERQIQSGRRPGALLLATGRPSARPRISAPPFAAARPPARSRRLSRLSIRRGDERAARNSRVHHATTKFSNLRESGGISKRRGQNNGALWKGKKRAGGREEGRPRTRKNE